MNEDYCVICGEYIGENNKMYCKKCEKKYLSEEEKDLTNVTIYDIIYSNN